MIDLVLPGHMMKEKESKKLKAVSEIELKLKATEEHLGKVYAYTEALERMLLDAVNMRQFGPEDLAFLHRLMEKYPEDGDVPIN